MALTALVYTFEVQLSHVDRGVYETLSFKAAQHPSETDEYLIARVLAYCLEYREGIAFSRGLAEPDEPAISIRDLTGALEAWIEIGLPDAARLHKASKASPRVAVYAHKDPRTWLGALEGERVHRREAIEVYALDRELIDALKERLDRRMKLEMTMTDGQLYVTTGGETLEGEIGRLPLNPP
jgi:uncharacterized protein YaeQ